ncbi:pilus assembly protein [Methylonatrum kenyense]|uniref:TadE/TadG family type IV pilus assembly protein n=1 Tax=Methylonatrum kenyense TaxID=455253 RepID=UPI0020BEF0DA|nr:TadE/TadG family type IV pilus assembly protein [Methylonatrum kenyense]MCK8515218.1 pilus assembly protein [Methylonatrum kenyense]
MAVLRTTRPRNRTKLLQSGAVAIEFALLFALAFALFYGAVVYAVTFLLSQSFESAAAEGTRAAVSVDRDNPDNGAGNCSGYADCVSQEATNAALERLAFLPANMRERVEVEPQLNGETLELLVIIRDYGAAPPLPPIPLPGLGSIPPLPDNLSAVSRIRL